MNQLQNHPRNDLTERLTKLWHLLRAMPVPSFTASALKNDAQTEIESQLVVGVYFDAMQEVVAGLDNIMQIYVSDARDVPHEVAAAVSLADDIFSDCPIPYVLVDDDSGAAVTGDGDDTPPPDDSNGYMTACNDCGGQFVDFVGDGLCAHCGFDYLSCESCGDDVDWTDDNGLCQSCAPLSDRDASPCECGGLQVCYCAGVSSCL